MKYIKYLILLIIIILVLWCFQYIIQQGDTNYNQKIDWGITNDNPISYKK